MSNAFPPHDNCPIPSVEAIDGSLVSSCQILDPAPTIWEFPRDFPLPQPTDFDFGCVCWPSIKTTLNSDATTPSFTVEIKYPNSAETGCCEPSIEMTLSPAACGKPVTQGDINYVVPEEAGASVERSTAPCVLDFQYNFDFWQRCPRFEVKGSVSMIYPWSSHSASLAGDVHSSWWTLKYPEMNWSLYSSISFASMANCQFYASLEFGWPLIQSSFVASSFATIEGPGDLCDIQLVKDFNDFTYNSETQTLELTYTVINAFSDGVKASLVDCATFNCHHTPCAPIGTQQVYAIYELEVTHGVACAFGPGALDVILPRDVFLDFNWDQAVCYDEAPGHWCPQPVPNPVVAQCCNSYDLLVAEAVEPTDWKTGCSGSMTFKSQNWTMPHDDWEIPDHVVKTMEHGQAVESLTITEKAACKCANDVYVNWSIDIYDFPNNGIDISSLSLLSSYSCSSYIPVWCWFEQLKFDEGLLVLREQTNRSCRPNDGIVC